MSNRFDGKVAVVTGAGGGIGEEYAKALHREGASVVVADIDEDGGKRVAAELGDRGLFVRTDVSDQASTDAMAAAAVEEFGGIDHLVNNAAIYKTMELAGLTNVDLAYLDKFMAVNLMGALHCTRSCLDALTADGGGAIVNQSSTAAWMAGGFYSLAKAGINSLTVNLAHELGWRNIRVNALAPGPTDTEATRTQVPAEYMQPLINSLAIKRLGQPDDMADALLFLLSDEARWITGHVLAVDGGQIAAHLMAELWHEERLYIDGKLVEAESGATYDNVNPADGSVLGVAADASPADVDRAIEGARRAFDDTSWSTDVALRARCLRQLHDAMVDHHAELGELTVAEVGAPRMLLDGPQLATPRGYLTWYADLAESYAWTTELGVAETLAGPANRWIQREPAGVVGAITPWNYPTQINLAKLAPALAAGCTVVLKAAPDTPWSALALGRLAAEHTDLPPGVLNIVTSSVKEIGELITTDPRVDMVSFTGSTAVGRRIMEAGAATIKRVFLELGGKSVHIMLDDIEDAGAGVGGACFQVCTHGGQGCATTSRLLLPRGRYEEGVEAAAALIAALPYGDPQDPGVMTGPIVNATQRDRIEGMVQQAVADGARVVVGGGRPAQFDSGFWFEPTLLADVDNSMTIARDEVFGPVLVAIPYDSDDEAVAIANDSIFGLSGAVVGQDRERALGIARRIRTGTMSINGGLWYGADVPFGGYKQSGVGREMGLAGFEEYLEQKAYAEPVA